MNIADGGSKRIPTAGILNARTTSSSSKDRRAINVVMNDMKKRGYVCKKLTIMWDGDL